MPRHEPEVEQARLRQRCELEDKIAALQCDVRAGRVSDGVAALKLTFLTAEWRKLSPPITQ